MAQGVVPDSGREIANSVNGAHAHDQVLTPERNLDEWVVDIKNRLYNQFPDQTKLSPATSGVDNTKTEQPSIFCVSRSSPKKFNIVHSLRRDRVSVTNDQGYIDMWGYLAFMYKWLDLNVKQYLEDMRKEEDRARAFYEEQYQLNLVTDSEQFLESLLVSSCFLCFSIILFHNVKKGPEILKGTGVNDESRDRCRSTQFYSLHGVIMKDQMRTKLDMLCLENQIPWFAVEAAFKNSKLSDPTNTTFTIEKLAMSCFDNLYPRANPNKFDYYSTPPAGVLKHLLHIFHWTRTPSKSEPYPYKKPRNEHKQFTEFNIPNATELLQSETLLRKFTGTVCETEYFSKIMSGSGLHITTLQILPYSLELYRNLLYFEQKYFECGLDFTAHFAFIRNLIATKADVELLEKRGILKNAMAGDTDVFRFVNGTGRLLAEELNAHIPSSIISQMYEVNEHHGRRTFSKEFSKFKRLFFPSRWVLITLLAGITLFVLTIIQTVYTVLSYDKA